MTGEKGNTGNHQEHEPGPHTHTHDRGTPTHDKIVPIHEHKTEHSPLIHSLSHNDWLGHHRAAKTPTMVEAAHLPHTEITGLQKPADRSLQHDLLDQTKDAGHRLGAAHKLWGAHASEIIDKDSHGKIVHLHIAENRHGKNTDIVVSQIDGKTSHPYLEGTIDTTGRIIKATAAQTASETIASGYVPVEQQANLGAHPHLQHHKDPGAHVHNASDEHHHIHIHGRHNEHHQAHEHGEYGEHHRLHVVRHSQSNACSYDQSDIQSAPGDSSQPASAPADINDRFQLAREQSGSASDKMIKLPDGAVYMRTHLQVDADGGSDWNTDSCGQAGTSLRNSNGQPLDAKHVNYFVLPMGEEWKRLGIKLGDIAWVRNAANGKIVPAIFGDEGPHNKIGEGSQGLCRALGLSDNPNHGGTDQKNIEFLIVPHSGTGKGDIARDPMQMEARLSNQPGASATA